MLNWLWQAIVSGVGDVGAAFLSVVGWILVKMAHWILKDVVEPLLGATVFQPESLTCSGGEIPIHMAQITAAKCGLVAYAAGKLWLLSLGASGAVALVALAWGALSLTFEGVYGARDRRALAEGAAMYVLVLVGGYVFLSTLLGVTNQVTAQLVSAANQIANVLPDSTGVSASLSIMAAMTLLFQGVAGLFVVGLLVWVVAVWVMRQVDLIFYTGLLPVTAAIAMSGNKSAFQWNWSEAVGALFSQLAMAVAWVTAWLVVKGAWSLPGGANQFVHMLVAAGAFTLVGRAPSMIQGFLGHQHAGVSGIMLGAAGGALISRGMQTAVRMSPTGAAIHQAVEARKRLAEAKAMMGATNPDGTPRATLGERLMSTQTGQRIRAGVNARIGQARAMATSAGSAAREFLTKERPGKLGGVATGLGRFTYGVGRLGATGASRALTAAVGATRPFRTAASMMYQPNLTIGRSLAQSYAEQGWAEERVLSNRAAAEMAVLGPEAVMRRHHLGNMRDFEAVLGVKGATNPPAFNPGAPQKSAFQVALDRYRRGQTRIPVPPNKRVYI
jgi:hypothetical protein